MISFQKQKQLIENNKKISKLLQENENILRKEGYNPPVKNFSLSQQQKIKIPSGYIRTVTKFNQKYHLVEIFPNRETRHNVTYALEVSDLFNFIFNRTNIWGSVSVILYKLAIVNLVSIIEAIILEATNNICYQASSCEKTKKCSYHFTKSERNNARKALEKLTLLNILDYDEVELARLQEIIDLRNRIHIRLTNGNEMKRADYHFHLYNEVILFLQSIDEQIYTNAVPLYHCNTIG